MRLAVPLLLVSCLGCSDEALEPGRFRIVLGEDAATWTEAPAVTSARFDKLLGDGTRRTLAEPTLPVESVALDLGGAGRYELSGLDAEGRVRVRGRSLGLLPTGLAGMTLPLYVARTGRFGVAPGRLGVPQQSRPLAAVVGGRLAYVVSSSTTSETAPDGYDLGGWAPLTSAGRLACPSAPCSIESFAVFDDWIGVVVGPDWAFYVDLYAGGGAALEPPEGLDGFQRVAGGTAVTTPQGALYLVGGTRPAAPTSAVLKIDTDGVLSALSLTAPRAGAAALWVPGRGLVVVGGSALGAGAELLAEDATSFAPLPFPPDPTLGAALAVVGDGVLARLGGLDPNGAPAASVRLPLGCARCTLEPAGPSVPLSAASAYPLDAGQVLVVGARADDQATGAVLYDAEQLRPAPLREPRLGSTSLLLPTGQVAVLGGSTPSGEPALAVELFTP